VGRPQLKRDPLGGSPTQMTLRFSFRPTPAEHARASTIILRRKRGFWIAIAVLVLVATGPVFFGAFRGYAVAQLISAFVPYVLIFGFIIAGMPVWQRWALRRVYRNTPTLQQEQTHEFSDAGFRMSNPLSNTLFNWEAFVGVLETRDFFFLYISRSMAYFLPKRAIPDQTQLQELRALLRAQLTRVGRNARLLAA
jgi:hypothetical protein